jgi:hypothetical protein
MHRFATAPSRSNAFVPEPIVSQVGQPALRFGDLALTSTRFAGGATAEVARRQPDGSWLWVIDQPRVVG